MDWPIRGNRSIPGCLSNELVIRPTAVTDGYPSVERWLVTAESTSDGPIRPTSRV